MDHNRALPHWDGHQLVDLLFEAGLAVHLGLEVEPVVVPLLRDGLLDVEQGGVCAVDLDTVRHVILVLGKPVNHCCDHFGIIARSWMLETSR